MLKKLQSNHQFSFFTSFEEQLDRSHPLYLLANKIDWQLLESQLSPLYSHRGRPAKPIRLMCGLLILKHVRNLSDESVVEQYGENAYYQYFCGGLQFESKFPCASSELVHFRHRIGEKGIELILSLSIAINDEDKPSSDDGVAFIDSTVQEKNITFPTDGKLHMKIIQHCWKIAKDNSIKIRQSYTRTVKRLSRTCRFANHPKNKKKARAATRKIKTIAGRLVRELQRTLQAEHSKQQDLTIFERVLAQTRKSTQKIYSLHEPEIQCISKGKAHKKYEFGNKVSIIWSNKGVIIGAQSFRNEYDGHTIEASLEQSKRLLGYCIKLLVGDRGYRGTSQVGETQILIPKPSLKRDSRYQKEKKKRLMRKRAGIEPCIGHLKSDFRLSRNMYKGVFGDTINVMLAAAAYNFKRAMRALFVPIFRAMIAMLYFIWYVMFESSSIFLCNSGLPIKANGVTKS